jgi:hypothetical protein
MWAVRAREASPPPLGRQIWSRARGGRRTQATMKKLFGRDKPKMAKVTNLSRDQAMAIPVRRPPPVPAPAADARRRPDRPGPAPHLLPAVQATAARPRRRARPPVARRPQPQHQPFACPGLFRRLGGPPTALPALLHRSASAADAHRLPLVLAQLPCAAIRLPNARLAAKFAQRRASAIAVPIGV